MNSLLVTIGLLFCLAAVNAQGYFGSSGCQRAQNRCDRCRQGCQNMCQQARNTCADIFAGSSTTTWSTTTFSSTTSPYSTTSYYPSSSTTYYPSSSTTYYPYSSSTTDSSGIGGGYFGNGGRRGGRRGGNVGGGSLGRRVVDPVPVVSRPVEAPCQGLSCFISGLLEGSNIAGGSNGGSNVVGGNNGLRRVNTGQVVGGNNGVRRVSTGGVTNVHNGGQTGVGIDGMLNGIIGGGRTIGGLDLGSIFGKK